MTPEQNEELIRQYIARRDPAAAHEHSYDEVTGELGICPQYACPFGT